MLKIITFFVFLCLGGCMLLSIPLTVVDTAVEVIKLPITTVDMVIDAVNGDEIEGEEKD